MIERWPTAVDIFQIYRLLTRLGVTANYAGFQQAAYAVYLCVQDPDKLALVTKWLYPEVSKHYHTTPGAVERNLRGVVKQAWEQNPCLLRKLAGSKEVSALVVVPSDLVVSVATVTLAPSATLLVLLRFSA